MPAERYYSMTERGEGIENGVVTTVTTAGTFDASYSRHGCGVSGTASSVESLGFLDAGQASNFWAHGVFHTPSTLAGASNTILWEALNSTGTVVFRVRATSGFTYQAEAWNGATYSSLGSTFTLTGNTRYAFDVHIVCTASAEVWINKASVAAGIVGAGVNNIARTRHRSPSTANLFTWSQMAGANFDLRDLFVRCLPPNSAGTHTAGAGDYTLVDENGLDDADMLIFASAGDKESVNAADYTLPAGIGVDSVWVVGRARGDILDFKWLLRSGGADHDSSELNVTTGFSPYARCWASNPATGNQIDQSALNSFEYGAVAF